VSCSASAQLLRFTLPPGQALNNNPGQYFTLAPSQALARPFYPVSPADSLGHVDFLFKNVIGGEFTAAVGKAVPGDQFELGYGGSFYQYIGAGKFIIG
jgi:NAD(P)H-flavin reductase